jgi:outer membrane lipoprotein carrier protein
MRRALLAGLLLLVAGMAHAAATDALRAFVRDAQSGSAAFTQTVTAPDGKKTKTSSGTFAFQRPNRFRFVYTKPFEQTIVGDGEKVWIHDPDLNQVSSRPMSAALGTTPAALLTGGALERDFDLQPLPDRDGLQWVKATPKAKEGNTFQSLQVGFRDSALAAIDLTDAFGQRSLLRFAELKTNATLPPDTFRFTPPPGADVVAQ